MRPSSRLCLAGGLLVAVPGLAESDVSALPGLVIDAKVTATRVLWIFPVSANDFEIDFYLDDPAPAFSSFMYRCEFITKGGNKAQVVMGRMTRARFKPGADGRLRAHKNKDVLPGGGLTGAQCGVTEVTK